AMAAEIETRLWSMEDVARLCDPGSRETRHLQAARPEGGMSDSPSTKARRKLRRRIENDQLAEQSRFWNRPRSADQRGYDQPVDRQAAKELRRAPAGPKISN
ncbi:MAG TPA: hypothetical protein VK432_03700, partial [Stellaceae bacterium]|nr:hypothetical protein [Stellaceae bacterium]